MGESLKHASSNGALDAVRVEKAGVSRRQVLARSAVAAGVVWAAPVIKTASAYALTASGTERPCTQFYVAGLTLEENYFPAYPYGFYPPKKKNSDERALAFTLISSTRASDSDSKDKDSKHKDKKKKDKKKKDDHGHGGGGHGGGEDNPKMIVPPLIATWTRDNPTIPLLEPDVYPQITQTGAHGWAVLLPEVTGPNAGGRQARFIVGYAYQGTHFAYGFVDPNPANPLLKGRRLLFPSPVGNDHEGDDDDNGDDDKDDNHHGSTSTSSTSSTSTTSTTSTTTPGATTTTTTTRPRRDDDGGNPFGPPPPTTTSSTTTTSTTTTTMPPPPSSTTSTSTTSTSTSTSTSTTTSSTTTTTTRPPATTTTTRRRNNDDDDKEHGNKHTTTTTRPPVTTTTTRPAATTTTTRPSGSTSSTTTTTRPSGGSTTTTSTTSPGGTTTTTSDDPWARWLAAGGPDTRGGGSSNGSGRDDRPSDSNRGGESAPKLKPFVETGVGAAGPSGPEAPVPSGRTGTRRFAELFDSQADGRPVLGSPISGVVLIYCKP